MVELDKESVDEVLSVIEKLAGMGIETTLPIGEAVELLEKLKKMSEEDMKKLKWEVVCSDCIDLSATISSVNVEVELRRDFDSIYVKDVYIKGRDLAIQVFSGGFCVYKNNESHDYFCLTNL